jgi:hypothetical protein
METADMERGPNAILGEHMQSLKSVQSDTRPHMTSYPAAPNHTSHSHSHDIHHT